MIAKSHVGLAACVLFGAILPVVCAPVEDPEDELKAAVVLGFLRYAEWPKPLANRTPITVGVSGRASFAPVLRRIVEGKVINNRGIRVVEISAVPDPACCHAIYFANDRSSEISRALRATETSPVLTIGDSKELLELGGAVRLMIVDGRMTFEVGLDALQKSGVSISSKLLRFGRIRGRPRGDQ
jgi:hypothetical protein